MGKNKEVEVDEESEDKSLRATIKEGSSFSWSKVIITALAAVTVAVISSQLNSIVNSILLVALLSIISAILNEGYRIFAIVAKAGAKKVTDPLLSNVPLLGGNKNDDDKEFSVTVESNAQTGALEVVKVSQSITTDTKVLEVIDEKLEKGEELWQLPDGTIVRASELDETERLKTAAFSAIKSAVGLKDSSNDDNDTSQSWWRSIRDFIAARPGMKLIVLFTIVAMVAIGASYAVTSRIEANNYTTINQPVVELSPEEKQELVDKAVDEAVAEAVEKAVSQSTVNDQELNSITHGNIDSLETTLATLIDRLTILETSLTSSSEETSVLASEIAQLRQLVDTLQLRVSELENPVTQ